MTVGIDPLTGPLSSPYVYSGGRGDLHESGGISNDHSHSVIAQTSAKMWKGQPLSRSNNPYSTLFGVARKDVGVDPDKSFQEEIRDLPDAYQGQNKQLGRILISQMTASRSFPINEICPYEKATGLRTEIQSWMFHDEYMGQVPEQGVPRLIRNSMRSRVGSVNRKGLAFTNEHGFLQTPMGEQCWWMQMEQINHACTDTLAHEVMFKLYSSEEESEYKAGRGMSAYQFDEVVRRNINMWGIFHKGTGGFELAVSKAKQTMVDRCGLEGNIVIIPAGSQSAAWQANLMNMGILHRESIKTDKTFWTNTDKVVMRESRSWQTYSDLKEDPAFRNRTIGSFNTMTMVGISQVKPEKFHMGTMMSIEIWNERKNGFEILSPGDTYKLTGAFPGWDDIPSDNNFAGTHDMNPFRGKTTQDYWGNETSVATPIIKTGAYLGGQNKGYTVDEDDEDAAFADSSAAAKSLRFGADPKRKEARPYAEWALEWFASKGWKSHGDAYSQQGYLRLLAECITNKDRISKDEYEILMTRHLYPGGSQPNAQQPRNGGGGGMDDLDDLDIPFIFPSFKVPVKAGEAGVNFYNAPVAAAIIENEIKAILKLGVAFRVPSGPKQQRFRSLIRAGRPYLSNVVGIQSADLMIKTMDDFIDTPSTSPFKTATDLGYAILSLLTMTPGTVGEFIESWVKRTGQLTDDEYSPQKKVKINFGLRNHDSLSTFEGSIFDCTLGQYQNLTNKTNEVVIVSNNNVEISGMITEVLGNSSTSMDLYCLRLSLLIKLIPFEGEDAKSEDTIAPIKSVVASLQSMEEVKNGKRFPINIYQAGYLPIIRTLNAMLKQDFNTIIWNNLRLPVVTVVGLDPPIQASNGRASVSSLRGDSLHNFQNAKVTPENREKVQTMLKQLQTKYKAEYKKHKITNRLPVCVQHEVLILYLLSVSTTPEFLKWTNTLGVRGIDNTIALIINTVQSLELVEMNDTQYQDAIRQTLGVIVASWTGDSQPSDPSIASVFNAVKDMKTEDLDPTSADKKLKRAPADLVDRLQTLHDKITTTRNQSIKNGKSNKLDDAVNFGGIGRDSNGNPIDVNVLESALTKRLSVNQLMQVLIDQTSFEKGYGFFKWVVDNNLPVCFGILSMRPNQVWDMGSLCLTFGGGEVGSMLFTMPDFQIANDAVRKIMIGNFTVYAGCLIKDPRKIVIIPDVYCRGYIGGWSTSSWDASNAEHRAQQARKPGACDFYHCLVEANYKSEDKWIFLNGRGPASVTGQTKASKLSYTSAQFYCNLWANWESNNDNLTAQVSSATQQNTMCFQDYQASYNVLNPGRALIVHNTGPWGENIYEGSADVRQGGQRFMESVNTRRVSLMSIGA